MPRIAPPPVDAVLALPEALRRTVPADFADGNGHVNIRHYLALHDEAGWAAFDALGLNEEYRQRTGYSLFDLEHHIRYDDEMLVGDDVSVHQRLVGRTDKVVHGLSFVVDRTRGSVANTLEFVSLHVDLRTRRSTPFPPERAAMIDERLGIDQALPWPAPLSGTVGLPGSR